jgi:NADPH-dependent 2,4-dienoyl-CoA reductase/sulfur reductase-like enzyme
VRLHTTAAAIRADHSAVTLAGGETLPFDYLVIATGAASRSLGVPGEDSEGIFCLRNLTDALRIKEFIEQRRAKRAVLVGAGFVSLEMCEAFRRRGLHTTVIHRKHIPMDRLGDDLSRKILEELEANAVVFMADTAVEGFERAASGEITVHTSNGKLETDLVLLGIGVVPAVDLAKEAGIVLGPTGGIAVNNRLQTNSPFIYAAGDCCECYHRVSGKPVYTPLGDVANKHGRVAGANIGGQELSFPGVVGSFCFKVFDLEVASTGLTEQEAREAGMDAVSATIQGVSKAHSYPGARRLWLRLVADTGSGRLLGAQAVGGDGVVSRVNALAAALTGNLSVQDVAYMDLAYAPPFSGAWDPLHIAAQQLLK